MVRRLPWGQEIARPIRACSTMKPKYSGDKSKRFWQRVNAVKDEFRRKALYQLGVDLQNLEEDVLRKLKAARKKAKK